MKYMILVIAALLFFLFGEESTANEGVELGVRCEYLSTIRHVQNHLQPERYSERQIVPEKLYISIVNPLVVPHDLSFEDMEIFKDDIFKARAHLISELNRCMKPEFKRSLDIDHSTNISPHQSHNNSSTLHIQLKFGFKKIYEERSILGAMTPVAMLCSREAPSCEIIESANGVMSLQIFLDNEASLKDAVARSASQIISYIESNYNPR